jgi:hypothetical protein
MKSLEDAGFHRPMLVSDGVVPPIAASPTRCSHVRIGIVPVFRMAVNATVGAEPFSIVFQDDIRVPKGFREWLEENLPQPPGIFSLYLSEGREAPGGWSVLEDDGEYPLHLGMCGVAMDYRTADRFVKAAPFQRVNGLGSQLAIWARREGIPFWLHSPSLVEHIGEKSVRDCVHEGHCVPA